MPQIDFFDDGTPIESAFKSAAKRLNERLNEKLNKELGVLLCECADKRDYDGFRFLIGRNPGLINARNADNDTPLILAANMGSEKITELALQQPDVEINAIGAEGMSAFMHACDQNYTDIGKLFLERPELDITIKDEDGDTALILAVQSENSELVRLILERDGANVEDKDLEGGSARSIAEAFKGDTFDQKEILELVKAHKTFVVKPEAKPQEAAATEVGTRRRRQATPATETPAEGVPEKPTDTSDIQSSELRKLAGQHPYPHTLAFLRWMESNGYDVLVKLTGKIMHEETKLRMPTIQRFISNESALYPDSGIRSSYDPKALSICKQIGYDPSSDYPLVSAEAGTAPKPPEAKL